MPKRYDDSFKKAFLHKVFETKRVAEAIEEFGVNKNTAYRWIHESGTSLRYMTNRIPNYELFDKVQRDGVKAACEFFNMSREAYYNRVARAKRKGEPYPENPKP
jgi:transposase-like protein